MKTDIETHARNVASRLLNCKGIIYTFGNGGSASIADHMACDWMKSADCGLRVISLSSNTSLLSAIGNDLGYLRTASYQINCLANERDLLILVSSSGESPNIIEAMDEAHTMGMTVIGFSGFKRSNRLNDDCDYGVHIDSTDYGTIEDYHSNVMHEVVRQLKERK